MDLQTAKYELTLALLRLLETLETVAARSKNGHTRPIADAAVSIEFGKLILFIRGEDFSENWRVTNYRIRDEAIDFDVSRQAGKITDRLTIGHAASNPFTSPSERRRDFAQRFTTLVKRVFPGLKNVRANQGKNVARHHQAAFVRVTGISGGRNVQAVGVDPGESQETVDALLGAALHAYFEKESSVDRLALFAPLGRTRTLAERLAFVTTPGIELYGFDADDIVGPIHPGEQPALVTGPARRYLLPRPDAPFTDEERGLLNDIIGADGEWIDVHPDGRVVRLRWLGLEFARMERRRGEPVIRFGLAGMGAPLRRLTENTRPLFDRLKVELRAHRRPRASDRTHPLYRAFAERWLEAVVSHNITRLDERLDPRFVYRQVPAFTRDAAGYVDLLGATRDGRLAVLELKASEDRELPWQGLDYWRRVDAHRRRGDFARRGYFPGLDLDATQPPILYLIAPMLRFHPTLDEMRRAIDGRVPMRVLGLSEHWRDELRVIRRGD